ncbi:MAG: hypothetical protein Ta2B_03810 [Termitinemataceae bacterium]|nr:MAG: hypothetical protein Ta2B_03810 [Termitinemataceae bacterium]
MKFKIIWAALLFSAAMTFIIGCDNSTPDTEPVDPKADWYPEDMDKETASISIPLTGDGAVGAIPSAEGKGLIDYYEVVFKTTGASPKYYSAFANEGSGYLSITVPADVTYDVLFLAGRKFSGGRQLLASALTPNQTINVGANTVNLTVKYITFATKAITVTSDGTAANADTTISPYNIYPLVRDKAYTASVAVSDISPLITAETWVTGAAPPSTLLLVSAKLKPLVSSSLPLCAAISESALANGTITVNPTTVTFSFTSSASAPDIDTIGRFEFQFNYRAFGEADPAKKAGSVWAIWTGTDYHNIETEDAAAKLNGGYFVKIGDPDLTALASGSVIFTF